MWPICQVQNRYLVMIVMHHFNDRNTKLPAYYIGPMLFEVAVAYFPGGYICYVFRHLNASLVICYEGIQHNFKLEIVLVFIALIFTQYREKSHEFQSLASFNMVGKLPSKQLFIFIYLSKKPCSKSRDGCSSIMAVLPLL